MRALLLWKGTWLSLIREVRLQVVGLCSYTEVGCQSIFQTTS